MSLLRELISAGVSEIRVADRDAWDAFTSSPRRRVFDHVASIAVSHAPNCPERHIKTLQGCYCIGKGGEQVIRLERA